jgi:hypothetical protein
MSRETIKRRKAEIKYTLFTWHNFNFIGSHTLVAYPHRLPSYWSQIEHILILCVSIGCLVGSHTLVAYPHRLPSYWSQIEHILILCVSIGCL